MPCIRLISSKMDQMQRLRDISIETDNLSRTDGSAVFAHGSSIVQCGVYGPSDVPGHKERAEEALIQIIFKSRIRPKEVTPEIKYKQNFIKKTLESIIYKNLHPRTAINVILQELQTDGSLLSVTLNAAICGLMDAGVQMKYLIASASCVIKKNGEIILDPSATESTDAAASLTFTFDNLQNKLVSTSSTGKFSLTQYRDCFKLCKESIQEIFQVYEDIIKKKFSLLQD